MAKELISGRAVFHRHLKNGPSANQVLQRRQISSASIEHGLPRPGSGDDEEDYSPYFLGLDLADHGRVRIVELSTQRVSAADIKFNHFYIFVMLHLKLIDAFSEFSGIDNKFCAHR